MSGGTGEDGWALLHRELALRAEQGQCARLWLRDDDAVCVTPALEQLTALLERHKVPAVIAVIPGLAGDGLAAHLAAHTLLQPAVHGWRHVNHAPSGAKKCELGGHRPLKVVCAELARAKARMEHLLDDGAVELLVPPWNRIAPEVAATLPGLGFTALSAYGCNLRASPVPGLTVVNCQVDIIDWRGTRGCRDHGVLAAETARALAEARVNDSGPVGILTHHMVHDDAAWAFLDRLFYEMAGHGTADWGLPHK